MSRRLTVDQARAMDFKDLAEAVFTLLRQFEAEGEETIQQREARISLTLDHGPDVYAWLLTLHSYFDHWTDVMADQLGMKHMGYKVYRQKRDLCKSAASAAKLRYDGASRRITQEQEHREAAGMRTGR